MAASFFLQRNPTEFHFLFNQFHRNNNHFPKAALCLWKNHFKEHKKNRHCSSCRIWSVLDGQHFDEHTGSLFRPELPERQRCQYFSNGGDELSSCSDLHGSIGTHCRRITLSRTRIWWIEQKESFACLHFFCPIFCIAAHSWLHWLLQCRQITSMHDSIPASRIRNCICIRKSRQHLGTNIATHNKQFTRNTFNVTRILPYEVNICRKLFSFRRTLPT